MNHSNRDLRKPASYCCDHMEQEVLREDIISYRWYTRDFFLRSSTTDQVFSFVEFCPWCSKYLTDYSLHDEYVEAYEKEKKKDSTLSDIMNYSALEDLQEKFLSNWESENQTLEKKKKQCNTINIIKEIPLRTTTWSKRTTKTRDLSSQEPQP